MSKQYSKEEVLAFLKNNIIMQVATANENKPSASVLLYAINDDFSVYFTTLAHTQKAKNLLANPQISLAIWRPQQMMVQADGVVEQVTGEAEIEQAVDQLAEAAASDENFWPPLLQFSGDDYIVFKVTPTWMRALNLREAKVHDKEIFSEIEV